MKKLVIAAGVLIGIGFVAKRLGAKFQNMDWEQAFRGDAGQRAAEADVPEYHGDPGEHPSHRVARRLSDPGGKRGSTSRRGRDMTQSLPEQRMRVAGRSPR